ncbi:hypothetical protein [Methylorubrum suomiense]|uniref:Uncharacterized protein n=1 Tax=Methylorubrum suomiense TaxID=144191 RepID=A0ABQ4V143_9HYPH|nr:hypothetical protein [Methylorubrum suomiense]GJE78073.1 hypothetical protein BGCPKDLD_4684 [Methylorubrum suomiense]
MSDQTLARDAMLDRMRQATPGGALFPTEPRVPRFDEAQAYATGMRAVASHPVLLTHLARAAGPIREALGRGETVVITANGRELARYEPEP